MDLRSSASNRTQSKSQVVMKVSTSRIRANTPRVLPSKVKKSALLDDASPQASSSLSRKRIRPSYSRETSPSNTLTLESPTKVKKIKLQAAYATVSPFPDHTHPTADETAEIYQLLTKTHQPVIRRPPERTSNPAQTCGNVPNVIEAIIGTILSQNTSSSNSTRAKANLDQAFGGNNFEAIAAAPKQKVVDAIRTGGLANKKAGMIQGLLHAVKRKHGSYSLQQLTRNPTDSVPALRDDEIMAELLSYDGIGPKTASCVLMFCIGRDSFAVDTHVYRLSRLLGWIPEKANRVTAQTHLDIRIPAELKYGLHMLMFQHGRECKGCKQAGSREGCVLKTYLKQRKKVREEGSSRELGEVELDKKINDGIQ